MTLRKITDRDLQGYGVTGMADTPNLSARAMQEKVEEVVRSVVIPIMNENVDNTASKQDLADAVLNAGAGDMLAASYDTNKDGVVNKADNGFFTYSHSKSGNVHYLDGSGDNIKFVATADFEDGDVFMLGDNYYPAFLSSGDSLPDGHFRADCVVTCFRHGNCLNFNNGGAGLNFKIVGGTTEPASPKENTIWVNTDDEITGWAFDADVPDYLPAGGVWIKTGLNSAAEFNAVKKNSIFIMPQSCMQWDGDVWTARDVKVYKEGRWLALKFWFLNGEDLCTDITGGWEKINSSYGEPTKSADGLTFTTTASGHRTTGTVQPVDFTGINTLYARIASISGNNTYGNCINFGVNATRTYANKSQAEQGWTVEHYVYRPTATTDVVYAADTSGITGDYYILFATSCSNSTTLNVVVNEIYGV